MNLGLDFSGIISQLNELYKNITLASEFDFEVTIAGNGCNAFEVKKCIDEVFRIIDLPEPFISDQERRDYLVSVGVNPDEYL